MSRLNVLSKSLAVASGAILFLSGVAMAAPMVIAADGFESGTTSGGTGWTDPWVASGATLRNTTYPYEGLYYIEMRTSGSGTDQQRSMTRQMDLSAADSPVLSFWWAPRLTEGGDDTLKVEFSYDGSNFTLIDTITVPASSSAATYREAVYPLSGTMTGTAQQLRLIATFNTTGSDYLYIDDVKITAVPEPAALSLLSLGGLAMLRRRRTLVIETV